MSSPSRSTAAANALYDKERSKHVRLDTFQSIELAEGVEIRLRIAGPYVRVLAYAIDLLIRGGVIIAASLLLLLVGMVIGERVATGFSLLLMFLLTFFYYVLFEAGKRGASPGKRIMGLRVVDTSGAPITFGQSFIRNMLRFADMMPGLYGFGLVCTLLTKRFQRMGDLLANTVVVYDRKESAHAKVSAVPPVLKSIMPPVALTREEQSALSGFRERSGMWSEARRVELADHATAISGSRGQKGMTRLLGMAHWLGEK